MRLTPQENYERTETLECPFHGVEVLPAAVCSFCKWPEEHDPELDRALKLMDIAEEYLREHPEARYKTGEDYDLEIIKRGLRPEERGEQDA